MAINQTEKRRHPKQAASPKSKLLHVLRHATSLLSSKELRDAVGNRWQDALAALRADGYSIEEIVGASNNRSFRLTSPPVTSRPQYLTEPAPDVLTRDHIAPTVQVTLRIDDIRELLRGSLPPRARDTLVGALMAYEEN